MQPCVTFYLKCLRFNNTHQHLSWEAALRFKIAFPSPLLRGTRTAHEGKNRRVLSKKISSFTRLLLLFLSCVSEPLHHPSPSPRLHIRTRSARHVSQHRDVHSALTLWGKIKYLSRHLQDKLLLSYFNMLPPINPQRWWIMEQAECACRGPGWVHLCVAQMGGGMRQTVGNVSAVNDFRLLTFFFLHAEPQRRLSSRLPQALHTRPWPTPWGWDLFARSLAFLMKPNTPFVVPSHSLL